MKIINICLEVNDTNDAIRVLNDINQIPVGELKRFSISEPYNFNRNRSSEEATNADND